MKIVLTVHFNYVNLTKFDFVGDLKLSSAQICTVYLLFVLLYDKGRECRIKFTFAFQNNLSI